MRPTGTVTLLFSDIEGSTRLLRAIGVERYKNSLQQHRLLLRDAFARPAGIGVHRAARISAAAHGDQIVLSQTTRDLLEDASGVSCLDLGVHPLKDFARPQQLYQRVDPRLPQACPPLRTQLRRPTNLAISPTALVGR
jgi:class 3 adenylate cyclase